MAILDMQDMKPEARSWGGGEGSALSALLCDSSISTLLCL
jgi:hypothetical protein